MSLRHTGIETLGGVRTALIKRNQTIPYSHTEIFSTAADNQQSVEIHVPKASERWRGTTGRWASSISKGSHPRLAVCRRSRSRSISTRTDLRPAKDKATGKEKDLTITNSSGVDQSEIDRMVQDAEEHAAADQERKEAIESRNKLDSMVYQTDKMLSENKDKLQAADIGTLETASHRRKKHLLRMIKPDWALSLHWSRRATNSLRLCTKLLLRAEILTAPSRRKTMVSLMLRSSKTSYASSVAWRL